MKKQVTHFPDVQGWKCTKQVYTLPKWTDVVVYETSLHTAQMYRCGSVRNEAAV
jgi:hypothetical protein